MKLETDIRVGDVMTKGVVTLKASDSAAQAAKLMKKNNVGSVIVLEEGKAVGISTERDIAFKVVAEGKDAKKVKARSIMGAPLKVVKASEVLNEAALLLKAHRIKRLPVVNDEGKLVGIITEDDFLRIYPGYLDIIKEATAIREFEKTTFYTGTCDNCGLYSETLRSERGRLLCDECREAEEV